MIGRLLQYLSIFVIVCGITVEVITGADYGYIIITIGSLLFATGTKIVYYAKNKRRVRR